MRRFGGWLGSKASIGDGPVLMTAEEEREALNAVQRQAALIMNDEIEEAERVLSQGSTPFHLLGRGFSLFLRSTIGIEKEVMAEASLRLGECEAMASEYEKKAKQDPSAVYQSKIYPVGAEYAMIQALCQLMSAVTAVLSENITESLKGFLKLRRALATLQAIKAAEDSFLARVSSAAATPTKSSQPSASTSTQDAEDSDDDLDFVDAEEAQPERDDLGTSTAAIAGLTLQNMADAQPKGKASSIRAQSGPNRSDEQAGADEDGIDIRTVTSDPIDLFTHSGTALSLGAINLVLSLIPPSLGKMLPLVAFRGDRKLGMRLLFSASNFSETAFGATSGLILLSFHNNAIAMADILTRDAIPRARLNAILLENRTRYPKSRLWMMMEANTEGLNRNLEAAVRISSSSSDTSFKQVKAISSFVTAMNLCWLHQFQESADAFLETIELNNWSHGFYYYMAGANYVEIYRDCPDKSSDQAKVFAEKARENFTAVPTNVKRKILGRQPPMDAFILRKTTKWDARAKAWDCDLIDAIGVSPIEEMAYIWSGYRLKTPVQLQMSLDRLTRGEDEAVNPRWKDQAVDERAVHAVLVASCLRHADRVGEAKAVLEAQVLCYEQRQIKACEHADDYALPTGHYEMAACLWREAGEEDGDQEVLRECKREVEVCSRWETYQLDSRVGLKVTTARETLRRCGVL